MFYLFARQMWYLVPRRFKREGKTGKVEVPNLLTWNMASLPGTVANEQQEWCGVADVIRLEFPGRS